MDCFKADQDSILFMAIKYPMEVLLAEQTSDKDKNQETSTVLRKCRKKD
jgi:hypothetical protein